MSKALQRVMKRKEEDEERRRRRRRSRIKTETITRGWLKGSKDLKKSRVNYPPCPPREKTHNAPQHPLQQMGLLSYYDHQSTSYELNNTPTHTPLLHTLKSPDSCNSGSTNHVEFACVCVCVNVCVCVHRGQHSVKMPGLDRLVRVSHFSEPELWREYGTGGAGGWKLIQEEEVRGSVGLKGGLQTGSPRRGWG